MAIFFGALVSFPAVLIFVMVPSLFVSGAAGLSTAMLFLEGSLEAAPQLLLVLYIILSDVTRSVAFTERISAVSAIFTISKTSLEQFVFDHDEEIGFLKKLAAIVHKSDFDHGRQAIELKLRNLLCIYLFREYRKF